MHLTAGWMFATMMTSAVGFGVFRYGKRETRAPQILCGLALMVLPALFASPLSVWGVSAALLGALWLATRAGL